MPNRTTAVLAACAAFLFAASVLPATARAQDGSITVGAHGSTLGAGVSLGYDISRSFSVRAVANYFSFDRKESSAGNRYSVDVQLLSLGLLGDWHPFRNGFRVTAGVLYNGNKFTFASRTSEFGAGDTDDYEGNLKAELGFNAVAPYLGIGWTSGRADGPGFSFFADAGVIYQGAPRLSVSGRADGQTSSCSFSVSESGRATVRGDCGLEDLSADLEREHADLKGQLDDFKFYPVVMLGVTYRF